MLFPIIRVKDNDYKNVHIVGTDEHDSLYIDKETGGIHYLNLQCICGTEKFENKSTFEFNGVKNEYSDNLQIEFVTFEELKKIYEKQKKKYLCKENFKSEKCNNDELVIKKYLTVRAGGIWKLLFQRRKNCYQFQENILINILKKLNKKEKRKEMYISYNEECKISAMISDKKSTVEIASELGVDIENLEKYLSEKKKLINRLKELLDNFKSNDSNQLQMKK